VSFWGQPPASVAPAGRSALNGTGVEPVPAIAEGGRALTAAAFGTNSNPGIRRPRWGGVAVGVAVSATPTRIEKKGRIDLVVELIGIGVTDALLSGY